MGKCISSQPLLDIRPHFSRRILSCSLNSLTARVCVFMIPTYKECLLIGDIEQGFYGHCGVSKG